MVDWITDRPVGYDPDLVYDESTSSWVAQSVQLPKAGEKYVWLIVVSEQEDIYFGAI